LMLLLRLVLLRLLVLMPRGSPLRGVAHSWRHPHSRTRPPHPRTPHSTHRAAVPSLGLGRCTVVPLPRLHSAR
jgi:hypothetical protein